MPALALGNCVDCQMPCLLSALPQKPFRDQITRLEVQNRTSLWLEESPAGNCYVICQGVIQLSQRAPDGSKLIIDLLGPGDVAGLMELLAHERRTTEAISLMKSKLVQMDRSTLLKLIEDYPDLAPELARVGAAAARHLSQRLLLACYGGVRERLIWVLLDLGRRFGRWEGQGLVIELELSKRDLEMLVGAGHVSTVKATEDLEQRGFALFRRRAIILPSPLRLSQTLGDLSEVRYWEGRSERECSRVTRSSVQT